MVSLFGAFCLLISLFHQIATVEASNILLDTVTPHTGQLSRSLMKVSRLLQDQHSSSIVPKYNLTLLLLVFDSLYLLTNTEAGSLEYRTQVAGIFIALARKSFDSRSYSKSSSARWTLSEMEHEIEARLIEGRRVKMMNEFIPSLKKFLNCRTEVIMNASLQLPKNARVLRDLVNSKVKGNFYAKVNEILNSLVKSPSVSDCLTFLNSFDVPAFPDPIIPDIEVEFTHNEEMLAPFDHEQFLNATIDAWKDFDFSQSSEVLRLFGNSIKLFAAARKKMGNSIFMKTFSRSHLSALDSRLKSWLMQLLTEANFSRTLLDKISKEIDLIDPKDPFKSIGCVKFMISEAAKFLDAYSFDNVCFTTDMYLKISIIIKAYPSFDLPQSSSKFGGIEGFVSKWLILSIENASSREIFNWLDSLTIECSSISIPFVEEPVRKTPSFSVPSDYSIVKTTEFFQFCIDGNTSLSAISFQGIFVTDAATVQSICKLINSYTNDEFLHEFSFEELDQLSEVLLANPLNDFHYQFYSGVGQSVFSLAILMRSKLQLKGLFPSAPCIVYLSPAESTQYKIDVVSKKDRHFILLRLISHFYGASEFQLTNRFLNAYKIFMTLDAKLVHYPEVQFLAEAFLFEKNPATFGVVFTNLPFGPLTYAFKFSIYLVRKIGHKTSHKMRLGVAKKVQSYIFKISENIPVLFIGYPFPSCFKDFNTELDDEMTGSISFLESKVPYQNFSALLQLMHDLTKLKKESWMYTVTCFLKEIQAESRRTRKIANIRLLHSEMLNFHVVIKKRLKLEKTDFPSTAAYLERNILIYEYTSFNRITNEIHEFLSFCGANDKLLVPLGMLIFSALSVYTLENIMKLHDIEFSRYISPSVDLFTTAAARPGQSILNHPSTWKGWTEDYTIDLFLSSPIQNQSPKAKYLKFFNTRAEIYFPSLIATLETKFSPLELASGKIDLFQIFSAHPSYQLISDQELGFSAAVWEGASDLLPSSIFKFSLANETKFPPFIYEQVSKYLLFVLAKNSGPYFNSFAKIKKNHSYLNCSDGQIARYERASLPILSIVSSMKSFTVGFHQLPPGFYQSMLESLHSESKFILQQNIDLLGYKDEDMLTIYFAFFTDGMFRLSQMQPQPLIFHFIREFESAVEFVGRKLFRILYSENYENLAFLIQRILQDFPKSQTMHLINSLDYSMKLMQFNRAISQKLLNLISLFCLMVKYTIAVIPLEPLHCAPFKQETYSSWAWSFIWSSKSKFDTYENMIFKGNQHLLPFWDRFSTKSDNILFLTSKTSFKSGSYDLLANGKSATLEAFVSQIPSVQFIQIKAKYGIIQLEGNSVISCFCKIVSYFQTKPFYFEISWKNVADLLNYYPEASILRKSAYSALLVSMNRTSKMHFHVNTMNSFLTQGDVEKLGLLLFSSMGIDNSSMVHYQSELEPQPESTYNAEYKLLIDLSLRYRIKYLTEFSARFVTPRGTKPAEAIKDGMYKNIIDCLSVKPDDSKLSFLGLGSDLISVNLNELFMMHRKKFFEIPYLDIDAFRKVSLIGFYYFKILQNACQANAKFNLDSLSLKFYSKVISLCAEMQHAFRVCVNDPSAFEKIDEIRLISPYVAVKSDRFPFKTPFYDFSLLGLDIPTRISFHSKLSLKISINRIIAYLKERGAIELDEKSLALFENQSVSPPKDPSSNLAIEFSFQVDNFERTADEKDERSPESLELSKEELNPLDAVEGTLKSERKRISPISAESKSPEFTSPKTFAKKDQISAHEKNTKTIERSKEPTIQKIKPTIPENTKKSIPANIIGPVTEKTKKFIPEQIKTTSSGASFVARKKSRGPKNFKAFDKTKFSTDECSNEDLVKSLLGGNSIAVKDIEEKAETPKNLISVAMNSPSEVENYESAQGDINKHEIPIVSKIHESDFNEVAKDKQYELNEAKNDKLINSAILIKNQDLENSNASSKVFSDGKKDKEKKNTATKSKISMAQASKVALKVLPNVDITSFLVAEADDEKPSNCSLPLSLSTNTRCDLGFALQEYQKSFAKTPLIAIDEKHINDIIPLSIEFANEICSSLLEIPDASKDLKMFTNQNSLLLLIEQLEAGYLNGFFVNWLTFLFEYLELFNREMFLSISQSSILKSIANNEPLIDSEASSLKMAKMLSIMSDSILQLQLVAESFQSASFFKDLELLSYFIGSRSSIKSIDLLYDKSYYFPSLITTHSVSALSISLNQLIDITSAMVQSILPKSLSSGYFTSEYCLALFLFLEAIKLAKNRADKLNLSILFAELLCIRQNLQTKAFDSYKNDFFLSESFLPRLLSSADFTSNWNSNYSLFEMLAHGRGNLYGPLDEFNKLDILLAYLLLKISSMEVLDENAIRNHTPLTSLFQLINFDISNEVSMEAFFADDAVDLANLELLSNKLVVAGSYSFSEDIIETKNYPIFKLFDNPSEFTLVPLKELCSLTLNEQSLIVLEIENSRKLGFSIRQINALNCLFYDKNMPTWQDLIELCSSFPGYSFSTISGTVINKVNFFIGAEPSEVLFMTTWLGFEIPEDKLLEILHILGEVGISTSSIFKVYSK